MWFEYSYQFLLGTREDSFYFVLYSNFSGSGLVRLNQMVNNFLAFWVSRRLSSMTVGLIWLFSPQRPENFNWLFFSFLWSGSSLASFAFSFQIPQFIWVSIFLGRQKQIPELKTNLIPHRKLLKDLSSPGSNKLRIRSIIKRSCVISLDFFFFPSRKQLLVRNSK